MKLKAVLLALIAITATTPVLLSAAPADFPVPEGIRQNIDFWKKVYSFYTTRELVFHDADELMRIYGVRQIPAGMNPWSRESQRLSRFEKERYRDILLKFSHGMSPENEEEARIFNLFGANADASVFRDAAGNIRTQLGQADRFKEGVIRSGRYLDHIQKVFAEYGLPVELTYLPHVESSFDYRAYSKIGAAGMWQFMRSTGRLYMKVNYVLDERRDPIRSTVAAAKLLKHNFEELQSWPLAVTAYNHGTAGMQRAVRSLGTRDYMTIFSQHDGRRFGFASRNFYSEFLAAKEVATNYRQYFGELRLEKPLQFAEITIDRNLDLNQLIKHFEVDKEAFEDLNLAFRPPAYRHGRLIPKGYPIRLPVDASKDYAALAASFSIRAADEAVVASANSAAEGDWIQVQPGDTLWSLSQQLKISANVLRDFNELDSSRLMAGQILKIPSGAALPPKRQIEPAVATKVAMLQPQVTQGADAPAAATPPLSGGNATPMVVARTQKAEALARDWDSLTLGSSALPKEEQQGWHGPPVSREWHGSLAVREVKGEGSARTGKVSLEPEETLGHLAEWLGLPTQRIRELNGFSFNHQIRIGQTIRLPLAKVTPEEFESRRMEYHQGLQEDFNSNYRIDGVAEYVIKRGDSIWRVAQEELTLPLWLLREYNVGKDIFSLQPGEQLTYPVVVPIQKGS